MKNQYFGALNDYYKYGLLRILQSEGAHRLLVVWMLTPDDGSTAGKRRTYLQAPQKWQSCDPELFVGIDTLFRDIPTNPTPWLSLFERAGLLPRSTYYSNPVSDTVLDRNRWRGGLLKAAASVELVFVDPDIGIEVPSKPVGRKGSSKYVTWQELEEIWKAGCSLFIYQHFPRKPRKPFAADMIQQLRRRTGARCTWTFQTSHVLFLLAAQEQHVQSFQRAISRSLPRWQQQTGLEVTTTYEKVSRIGASIRKVLKW